MTEPNLLPCPFCRNAMQFRKALWPSDGNVDAIIHAEPTECGLADFSDGTTDESIIAKWNVRSIDRITAERDGLKEALTASGDTKAAYIGEFKFHRTIMIDGDEHTEEVQVPWTTIKEIMAAIRARAALATSSLPDADSRTCTCHPDDSPPRPCPRKFALTECRQAAANGGDHV